MAICLLVQIFHPTIALISRLNVQLPYTSLSLSLNILIPLLISVQILSKKKRIARALGPQYADQYTSIIAMIVESAAPDFVFAIPYLILFGSKNPAQNILVSSLTQIEVGIYHSVNIQIVQADTDYVTNFSSLWLFWSFPELRADAHGLHRQLRLYLER